MTDHTWGVDKSHYDSAGGTAQIVAEGFGFLTHKAGGDSDDGELNAWWNDAKGYRDGLLLGAYWVLYPGHAASAGDAFVARLDSQCPGWRDGPFILQLDCEEWGGNPATKPGVGDIRACALRLRALAPKLVPVVYAPRWAYGNSLSGLGFPLWSSSYTTAKGTAQAIYPGDSYSGWAAYSGIVPTIAQFSSNGLVAGDPTTDVNCFKGTVQQLTTLLAPGWETDMALSSDDKAWLQQQIASVAAFDSPQPDGTPTSRIGRAVLTQGIPDGTLDAGDGTPIPRDYTWRVLTNIGRTLRSVAADVAALKAAAGTAQVNVDALAAALNPLIDNVEITPAVVEQALRDLVNGPPKTPAVLTGGEHPPFDTSDTPIHDEAADDFTRRERQARQGHIAGPTG